MPGTPNALQGGRDVPGAPHLDDEIDAPDVDSHLQGRGGHDCTELSMFQTLLDIKPDLLVHRTMVTSNQVPQHRTEVLDQVLGHLPRVGEDQRRGMCGDEFGDDIDVPFEDRLHRHVREGRVAEEDVEVQGSDTTDLRDRDALFPASCLAVITRDQVLRHGLQGLHRRGDADALQASEQGVEMGDGEER